MPRLDHIGWFQAPTRPIRPYTIRPGSQLVELLTGGLVRFNINGTEKICGAGSMFWHVEGEETVHRSVLENPYNCLTVSFTGIGKKRDIPRYSFWPDRGAVQSFKETALKAFHDTLYRSDVFTSFIYSTLRWIAFSSAKRTQQQMYPEPLSLLVNFVEERLGEDLSVVVLAKQIDRSPSHVHALFQEHLGLSPHQHIINRRLQTAKQLVAGTGLQVKEISRDVGFKNPESFCRAFKTEIGVAPLEYRRRSRKQ